jgi:Cd2+/Zn2+-exporting ATPase
MNKKQKKTLYRILITAVLFVALIVAEHVGLLDTLHPLLLFGLYFVPYLIIGYDVLIRAGKNISKGHVFDENFLMVLATFAAFALGLFGENEYTEALAVMLFYQIGELFQSVAVGKSRGAIAEMMSIAPEYANLEKDGELTEVDPDEVHPGDLIVVRPGEKVPLDGVVEEGESFLDTAALTGESVPRKVRVGEDVISGCVNGENTLKIRVTKEYEDSTVAKILELVENAGTRKARLENFITRFAKYYTPVVTIGAVILAVIPPILGMVPWADSIRRACNFLIVSCPCALVISVPLGFFGGIGAASKIGVLVKGSNYLESVAEIKTLMMDKTGTLTKGEFTVTSILPSVGQLDKDLTKEELLEMAALGEAYSTHPIAASILSAYGKTPDLSRMSDVTEEAGSGVIAKLDGKELLVGNARLMDSHHIPFVPYANGGTVVYTAFEGKLAGCLVIGDSLKEGAVEAIRDMKEAGIRKVVMLTGDRLQAAKQVASELGLTDVCAELLPGDKVSAVEKEIDALQSFDEKAKLGFVGDGINDAPVLMRADVGFAMGSMGSDAAIEAADIVLMDDDIRKIPAVIRIARKTMGIVKANIVFAIGVKVLILILSVFGLASMWAAVFADVGVAVICIINSMRALSYRGGL